MLVRIVLVSIVNAMRSDLVTISAGRIGAAGGRPAGERARQTTYGLR
jgi:hypothetical protein